MNEKGGGVTYQSRGHTRTGSAPKTAAQKSGESERK